MNGVEYSSIDFIDAETVSVKIRKRENDEVAAIILKSPEYPGLTYRVLIKQRHIDDVQSTGIGVISLGVTAFGYTAYKSHEKTGEIDWIDSAISGMSVFIIQYSLGTSAYGVICLLQYV